MKIFNTSGWGLPPTLKKIISIMKLTTLALILFCVNISASVYSQKTKLSLDVHNQSIKEILYQIEGQSEFRFIYESGKINLDKKVSVRVTDQPVETILNQLFEKEGLKYEITDNNLIIIHSKGKNNTPGTETILQEKREIKGTVVDENGETIIGANIVEKGTTNGAITDIDGNFTITVPSNAVLLISYIGYMDQQISIGNQNTIHIILKEDSQNLEEVVVIGYGSQKKASLTGSISNVKIDEQLRSISSSNVSSVLAGTMAGLKVNNRSGVPGESSEIAIRTAGSWNSTPPIYVIDGVVREKADFDRLDINEIDNISVLKDAASAAIYGSRSSGGVILITTR